MKKLVVLIIIVCGCSIGYSQSPQVPSRMTFADLKLKISESGRNAIQKEVNTITQNETYFNTKVEKAHIYFPMIERAYREEEVPDDFKYLALQESSLIPDAVSSSNAVGYWQFKDFTAVEVGLRVDKHIDERKNIYASSRGSARYMKNNNAHFNNWLYALQAYQMGAGAALKVLDKRHHGAKALEITDKTYWYVRTFLAHKIAYESAVKRWNSSTSLVGYYNGEGKTLHDIAKETNTDLAQLEHYNLWLRKGKIPNDRDYVVIIPTTDPASLNMDNLKLDNEPVTLVDRLPDVDEFQAKKYPVIDKNYDSKYPLIVKINGLVGVIAKNNDALRDLAIAGRIDIGKLLKYNDIEIDHKVVPGQVYYLHKKKSKAKVHYHILEEESLWDVSQKYGIRVSKLIMKNRITDGEILKPGRVLWLRYIRPVSIPVGYKRYKSPRPKLLNPMEKEDEQIQSDTTRTSNVTLTATVNYLDETSTIVSLTNESIDDLSNSDEEFVVEENDSKKYSIEHIHVIKPGETLYAISKMYGVEVMEIVEWNSIDLRAKINPGEELVIKTVQDKSDKIDTMDLTEVDTQLYEHTVGTGETLYSISRQYQVSVEQLMDWNKRENYNLSVGDIIKIIKPNLK